MLLSHRHGFDLATTKVESTRRPGTIRINVLSGVGGPEWKTICINRSTAGLHLERSSVHVEGARKVHESLPLFSSCRRRLDENSIDETGRGPEP